MPTIETPIRWGILGCGDVAEHKGGPALYRAAGSELVAVMRRDLGKAEDFARRHGAKCAYDSVAGLLNDGEIDAVYIATPPHLHCEQTIACADAGIKKILVEKPMALSADECDTMNRVCYEKGVLLHVAYYRRFWQKFVAVKAVLDSGGIGTIVGARLQVCSMNPNGGWRVDPTISGIGGHFADMGSHRVDMLRNLLGDVTDVHGFSDNVAAQHTAVEDTVFCLRFANRVVVSASFHFQTQPSSDILEIYGTEGTLTCDLFDSETFKVRRGGETDFHTYPNPKPTHLPFVEALIAVYNGDTDLPHVTGEEGAKTARVMDAILANRFRDAA